jgi:hypothetical protein
MSEEVEKEVRLYLRRKRLFEELLASEAWKELEGILKAQREQQLRQLLEAGLPEGGDGVLQVLRSEYRKGVIFGLELAVQTPRATIAIAQQLIQDTRQKERSSTDASGNGTTGDDDDDLGPGVHVTDLSGT